MQETLICREGNHKFEREVRRGKKPVYCEKHRPERAIPRPARLTDAGPVEILTCAFDGHDFERLRARGQKPRFCPEHTQIIRNSNLDPDDVSLDDRARVNFNWTPAIKDESLEILTSDVFIDPEFLRKLQFVVDRLGDQQYMERNLRADPPVTIMVSRQRELLTEFHRRWPRAAEAISGVAQAA